MKAKLLVFMFLFFAMEAAAAPADDVPVLFRGRFRPINVYAKLWTNEAQNKGKDLWKIALNTSDESYETSMRTLLQRKLSFKDASHLLERELPLQTRLKAQGDVLKVLPGRQNNGDWYSVKALGLKVFNPKNGEFEKVSNFTAYPDETFSVLQKQYLKLEEMAKGGNIEQDAPPLSEFKSLLFKAYLPFAGKPYTQAHGKTLAYPTVSALKMENFYYSLPLISTCLALYGGAALLLTWAIFQPHPPLRFFGKGFLAAALVLHTAILGMRSFILGRPPVSNMFETVVYVPLIAVWASLAFSYKMKNAHVLIASSLLALVLLVLLKITHLNSDLENVQAVLDSQFWLIIHVLMVVGSYGMFLLSGILGHIYLIRRLGKGKEDEMRTLSQMILQTMYLGTALLVPGTILGGIWAAESWGRFWAWDPKESWAFISSCVYLMWIHAFRFHHIASFGLAVGSIVGLQAITFTWYGVNYILGTGLHTYGFGSGGEIYYYLFVLVELFFVLTVWLIERKRTRGLNLPF